MYKKIQLWWKQLWCTHDWEHKIIYCSYIEEWYECKHCKKQEELI